MNGFHRRSKPKTVRSWAHRKAAAALRANFVEGTPCRRCGQRMWSSQRLQAGHHPLRPAATGALPDALEHGVCNERAGQREGARIRNRRHGRVNPSRVW